MSTQIGPVEDGFVGRLRTAALLAVLAGAVGSASLTLYAGRHNDSRILQALFVVWVLSPFVILLLADFAAKRWRIQARATLYGVMLLLTVVSLTIYGTVALGPPRPKTAFVFVVVPPASWLLIAIVLTTAGLLSRRLSSTIDLDRD